MSHWTQEQIDAGADALRRRLMSGRALRDWDDLPNPTKRTWRDHAVTVLDAAGPAGEHLLRSLGRERRREAARRQSEEGA
jgi:hypothetical protein